jgi:hypothetical protein
MPFSLSTFESFLSRPSRDCKKLVLGDQFANTPSLKRVSVFNRLHRNPDTFGVELWRR